MSVDFRELAKKIFHGMEPIVCNLHSRWQDEHEYEDFKEYENAMRVKFEKLTLGVIIPNSVKFIKAQKKPFGFIYTIGNRIVTIEVNSERYKQSSRLS